MSRDAAETIQKLRARVRELEAIIADLKSPPVRDAIEAEHELEPWFAGASSQFAGKTDDELRVIVCDPNRSIGESYDASCELERRRRPT